MVVVVVVVEVVAAAAVVGAVVVLLVVPGGAWWLQLLPAVCDLRVAADVNMITVCSCGGVGALVVICGLVVSLAAEYIRPPEMLPSLEERNPGIALAYKGLGVSPKSEWTECVRVRQVVFWGVSGTGQGLVFGDRKLQLAFKIWGPRPQIYPKCNRTTIPKPVACPKTPAHTAIGPA